MPKTQLIIDTKNGHEYVDSGSTMQDGIVTIKKHLYLMVPQGEDPREYTDLDCYASTYFPAKGAVMAENPAYHFTGNASISHWNADGHYWDCELEYSNSYGSSVDIEGNSINNNTQPWKLKPEVTVHYPKYKIAVQEAFDSKGQRSVPFANTYGDIFVGEEDEVTNIAWDISYYAQSWNTANGVSYTNTTNAKAINIGGTSIPAGRALLTCGDCQNLTTYNENSSSVKWNYWQVKVTIEFDVHGVVIYRQPFNLGNRAIFDAFTYSDDLISSYGLRADDGPIYSFHKLVRYGSGANAEYYQNGDLQFCTGKKFFSIYRKVISASKDLKQGPIYLDAEKMEQMPLTADGHLDTNAITSKQYLKRTFLMKKPASWDFLRSLNILTWSK